MDGSYGNYGSYSGYGGGGGGYSDYDVGGSGKLFITLCVVATVVVIGKAVYKHYNPEQQSQTTLGR